MLEPKTRERFLAIQEKVPAGETILSYVSASVYPDFSRNRILDVHVGGLDTPWLKFPLEASADDAGLFLCDQGVGYVLWEHRGYAVLSRQELETMAYTLAPADRREARNRLSLNRLMQKLSAQAEVLHDDGFYRLFRIGQTAAATESR